MLKAAIIKVSSTAAKFLMMLLLIVGLTTVAMAQATLNDDAYTVNTPEAGNWTEKSITGSSKVLKRPVDE